MVHDVHSFIVLGRNFSHHKTEVVFYFAADHVHQVGLRQDRGEDVLLGLVVNDFALIFGAVLGFELSANAVVSQGYSASLEYCKVGILDNDQSY